MSKQRFYITDTGLGLDTVSDEIYNFGNEEDFCRLFDKLNEQQAIITELNKQIEQLNLAIDDLLSHTSCDEIKKENEQLRKELNDCEKFRYTILKRIEELSNAKLVIE